jgi:hypothetical protein
LFTRSAAYNQPGGQGAKPQDRVDFIKDYMSG